MLSMILASLEKVATRGRRSVMSSVNAKEEKRSEKEVGAKKRKNFPSFLQGFNEIQSAFRTASRSEKR